jgi:hypothetical protein
MKYHFKSEPKPDYVIRVHLNNNLHFACDGKANLRLVFSGETGRLIEAKLL